MLRSTDAHTQKFLTDLSRIVRRMEDAQRQVTSGKRINTVSDSPDEISRLLQVRTELGATQQIKSNLDRVQGEVDGSEAALRHAVDLMDRVSVLGAQGGTDTLGADEREALSQEVGQILEQLVGIAGTSMDGRYVFSGDSDQDPPYSIDTALDEPFSVYQGSTSSREVQHPSGRRFSVALTADQIFDDPDASVFQSVNRLRLALRDNDPQAIRDAMANVKQASTHLNSSLAFYGATQNQVAEAVDYSQQQELRLQTQLSSIQDADLASAILELNDAQFQHQTALSAEAQRTRTSLFDYLR